jgi:hypothetical protein
MKKLLALLLLPLFGCGTCTLTKSIDNTSKVVSTARKGAKAILDDRCMDIAKDTCKKAFKDQPLPPCPELDECRKLRRQVYANASRIQITLASALAFEGVNNDKAKQIYEKAKKAAIEFLALLAKHKLVLEGVGL